MPWDIFNPTPVPTPKVPGWWAVYSVVLPSIASAEAFGTPFVGNFQAATLTGIPSGEEFGQLSLAYPQTVTLSGIVSAEAFGGSQTNPGQVSLQLFGIGTAEAFGTPSATTGVVSITPAGIASGEAFGSTQIVTGPVGAILSGIASSEAFGTPAVTPRVGLSGIPSEEAFGALVAKYTASLLGIGPAEAFGAMNVIGPPQPIALPGIPSAEAFGGSQAAPGDVTIGLQGVPTAEAFGTPTLTVGAVTTTLSGIPTGQAFGTLKANQNVTLGSVASAEAFGAPKVNRTAFLAGIASAEAFGTPAASNASIPIDFIGIWAPSDTTGSASWSVTTLTGDTVIVDIVLLGSADVTACTYDGVAMTRNGDVYTNNVASNGRLVRYVKHGVAGGTKTVAVTKTGFGWISAQATAYRNAGSVGTSVAVYGNSNTLSHGPVASPGLLVQTFAVVNSSVGVSQLTSHAGGDLRRNHRGAVTTPSVSIMDSQPTTTFTASMATAAPWASIVTPLSPL